MSTIRATSRFLFFAFAFSLFLTSHFSILHTFAACTHHSEAHSEQEPTASEHNHKCCTIATQYVVPALSLDINKVPTLVHQPDILSFFHIEPVLEGPFQPPRFNS